MNYNFFEHLVLRTPAKPLITKFSPEFLKKFFSNKSNLEALFVSSPNLHDQTMRWLHNNGFDEKKEMKLINSLYKYCSRMHSRCTPFGLMAGCSTFEWGDTTNIQISNESRRKTRLDMHFLCTLGDFLKNDQYIRSLLKFSPNNTLYKSGQNLRYIEYFMTDKGRIHQLSSISNDEYISKALDFSDKGVTIEELCRELQSEEISETDAKEFIEQLIDNQILLSEIEPSVTGGDYFDHIINVIKTKSQSSSSDKLNDYLKNLERINFLLSSLDIDSTKYLQYYSEIESIIKSLKIPFERNKLFQVDLFKTNEPSHLDKRFQEELRNCFKILNRLSPHYEPNTLLEFKKRFRERYEDDEVLLTEVLDIENGIGYGSYKDASSDLNPLIDELNVPQIVNGERTIIWNDVQAFLLSELMKCYRDGKKVLKIKNDDVRFFSENWLDLPDTMYTYLNIFKEDGKEKLAIKQTAGSSGGNMLGRFAYGSDEMSSIIEDIVETERDLNEGSVLAEIAHLPENRVGNVLSRPNFREYEIPYLSRSVLDPNRQVNIQDLYVSIKGDKLILRSKKLNKEIIPRMTNMHNYTANALPVYHFLCDVQLQQKRKSMVFSWGSLQEEFQFLPRVEINDIVVFPSTWQILKIDYKKIIESEGVNMIAVKELREKHSLPKLMLLVQGDNKLLINFEDELSVNMFKSIAKKNQFLKLEEFYFENGESSVVNNENESFANEILFFLKRNVAISNHKILDYISKTKPDTHPSSSFLAGSEWVYFKLYSGVKTGDDIIVSHIKKCMDSMISEQIISKWFFIRYADPNTHLRVRFLIKDRNKLGKSIEIFNSYLKPLYEDKKIWKSVIDSYKREIERYGENSIEDAESIFYYDSICISKIVELVNENDNEELRWSAGLVLVDQLLEDFEFNIEKKLELLETLRNGYSREFRMSKFLKLQIDNHYRKNRKHIEGVINRDITVFEGYNEILRFIRDKSTSIIPHVSNIKSSDSTYEIDQIVASHVHMILNRLFKNKQRTHELVLYDFLWRVYKSQKARIENQNKKQLVSS